MLYNLKVNSWLVVGLLKSVLKKSTYAADWFWISKSFIFRFFGIAEIITNQLEDMLNCFKTGISLNLPHTSDPAHIIFDWNRSGSTNSIWILFGFLSLRVP